MAAPADLSNVFVTALRQQIEENNTLAAKIQAASGDNGKMVHDIRENTETGDENVLKFRAWYEKANAQIEAKVAEINKYISDNLLPAADGSFDVEAAKSQYNENKKNISAGLVYAKSMLSEEDLSNLPAQQNLRGTSTSASGSGQSGVKRPRISSTTVNGEEVKDTREKKDGTKEDFTSFTVLALALTKASGTTVSGSDLRSSVYEILGTEDLSQDSVKGKEARFHKTYNEKEFDILVIV